MVAVPFPLSVKVTPDGSFPLSVSAGTGNPVVVTVKLPLVPTVKVADARLVILGGWLTLSVKLWEAEGFTPLLAVIWMM